MKFPLITIITALSCVKLLAGNPLTKKDQEDLSSKYEQMYQYMKKGQGIDLSEVVDKDSLVEYMKLHKEFSELMFSVSDEKSLASMLVFSPDYHTVMKIEDPALYFKSVKQGEGMKMMAQKANEVNKVVGVTGDDSKAFVVVEGYFDGDLGTTDPHYSVWPAIKTDQGWRLVLKSNVIKSMRGNIKDFRTRFMPNGE
jgi:hypothetical protein